MASNLLTEAELAGVNLKRLVPLVRRLVEVIGIVHTFSLLKARGGVPLRVPVSADRDSATLLKGILPDDAVLKLCATWPGQWLNLPKADRIITQVRDYYLRAEREQLSRNDTALRYHLTPRQISNICKYDDDKVIKPPKPVDDRQVDLFPED